MILDRRQKKPLYCPAGSTEIIVLGAREITIVQSCPMKKLAGSTENIVL
jgi:hypothetical protein